LFGPPGGGKSHLAAALGFALVENGWRVLFPRTTDLVQRLQIARRELALEAAIAKLDKFHLLILDDIAYVTKDQAETACSSNSLVPGTSGDPSSSLPISRSANGARSSRTRQ
jgi:DNA replication protein DnaC